MKRWLGIVIGWLFGLIAQGQPPVDVTWGAVERLPRKTLLKSLVLAPDGGFYLLHDKARAFLSKERAYLQYYDRDLRRRREGPLDLRPGGRRLASFDLFDLRGRLFWLVTETDKRAQKKTIYAQEIDGARLRTRGALLPIGETVVVNKKRQGVFDLAFAPDSSHVLVYSLLPSDRSIPPRFDLRVFDSAFRPIWERSVELPGREYRLRVQEYRIDARGNVFVLGRQYAANGRPLGFRILAYLQGGAVVRDYPIRPQGYEITHLTFRIGKAGDLVCSGFFARPGESRSRGACYFRVDPLSGEATGLSFDEFNFDFINEFMSDRRREEVKEETQAGDRRGPRLRAYRLKDLVLRTDGGGLLVAEQAYLDDFVTPSIDGTLRVDYFYHFNDVVIINIQPGGAVEWAARIPKRQVTRNDNGRYSSYAMSIFRDRLFFIFNDNQYNFEGTQRRNKLYPFHNRSPVLALTEVSKTGRLRTFPLYAGRSPGLRVRPSQCRQVGLREMLLYGESGRSFQLGRMRFQE